MLSKSRLSSLLGASGEGSSQDLDRCLAKGRLLNLKDQDRIKWITNSSILKEWLSYPRSKTLLINGNSEGNEVFSSTTFLNAKFCDALRCIEPIITLNFFFCSLHTTPIEGYDNDPIGLLRSLIEQLVSHNFAWDLTFLNQRNLNELKAADLDSLYRVFRKLLLQLPRITLLYCMIDGITYYERFEHHSNFEVVIERLLDIIDDCEKLVIKLLLTCHGRSTCIKDFIQDNDILTVPYTVDGDRQGFSDYGWDGEMGKNLEDLKDNATGSDSWT